MHGNFNEKHFNVEREVAVFTCLSLREISGSDGFGSDGLFGTPDTIFNSSQDNGFGSDDMFSAASQPDMGSSEDVAGEGLVNMILHYNGSNSSVRRLKLEWDYKVSESICVYDEEKVTSGYGDSHSTFFDGEVTSQELKVRGWSSGDEGIPRVRGTIKECSVLDRKGIEEFISEQLGSAQFLISWEEHHFSFRWGYGMFDISFYGIPGSSKLYFYLTGNSNLVGLLDKDITDRDVLLDIARKMCVVIANAGSSWNNESMGKLKDLLK